MNWISERPTTPGWYWWRLRTQLNMVEVFETDYEGLCAWGSRAVVNVTRLHEFPDYNVGEWAGPIAVPARD